MKHLFIFFTLTVLLASCGALNKGKLRFVKAHPQEIVSSEKETHRKHPISDPTEQIYLKQQTADLAQTSDVVTSSTEDKIIPTKELIHDVSIDDSLETVQNDQLAKALKTEKLSIKSTGFFIGGILTSLVPFLGLLFFLLGVSNFLNAKNQRYNTLRGERYLNVSTILFAINAFLVAFCLFLLIALVLAFL
jgi:hypothetical protein